MNYREAAVAAVECSATGGPNQPVQTGKNHIAAVAVVFVLVRTEGTQSLFPSIQSIDRCSRQQQNAPNQLTVDFDLTLPPGNTTSGLPEIWD